jgi:hypothetical protein
MAPWRRWLIVGSIILVLVAAATLLWRSQRPQRTAQRSKVFTFSTVPIESPDLMIEMIEVRGDPVEGSLDWRILFSCVQPEGCYAAVAVHVDYRSGGDLLQTRFLDTIAAPAGGTFRIGGLKPAVEVDTVERIGIRVKRRSEPGEPPPTPVV